MQFAVKKKINYASIHKLADKYGIDFNAIKAKYQNGEKLEDNENKKNNNGIDNENVVNGEKNEENSQLPNIYNE